MNVNLFSQNSGFEVVFLMFSIFREKEKSDLKSRVVELEEFQGKYENEKKENEVTFTAVIV